MKTKASLSQWIDGKSDFPQDLDGQKTFEKIKTYSAQLQAPAFDKQGVFEKIKSIKAEKTKPKTSPYNYILKIAAIFIALVGVTAIIHQMSWQITKTGMAQNQTVSLPDNSEVLVQAGSELKFNTLSWFFTREVKLQGEAFFEVEKGKTFSVKTNVGQVQVLGTKFNVKSMANGLNVVCYEGRVEVVQDKARAVIQANEYVVLENDKVLSKNQLILNELPTESNYFQIVDRDFKDLINDVERYYNIELSVGEIKREKHFTGKLPKNDVKRALLIISKTFKLKYKSANGNNYIFVDDASQ